MITVHDCYCIVILFVWADSLLATYVLVNAIDVDIHDQLFVATDVERSDCVHLLLGALQG